MQGFQGMAGNSLTRCSPLGTVARGFGFRHDHRMRDALILVALSASSPVLAAELHPHPLVETMSDRPCTEFVAMIDQDARTPDHLANQAMAWGMLLGFDTALGGLARDGNTVLVRLRKACADSPTISASRLLLRMDP